METASEKLLRIHQLWKELERMKPDTSESEALMKKIRVLSAEYQTLTEGPKPSRKNRNESLPENPSSIPYSVSSSMPSSIKDQKKAR